MSLDTIAAKFASWGAPGIKIAAALTVIYTAYQKLEPTTKASIDADLKTLQAEWSALDNAFTAYDNDNDLSKAAAAMAIVNVIAKAVPIITRVSKDGATVFGADWQVIKPQVDVILGTFKGTAQ